MRASRRSGLVDKVLVRSIAQATISRFGVRPGRVRAGVLVLGVQGRWSHFPAPGVLACSGAVAADHELLRPLLAEAFRSGLDGEEVPIVPVSPRRRPLPASVLTEPLPNCLGQGWTLVLE